MTEQRVTVDVADIVNRQPVTLFQVIVVALCATVVFLDGFDTLALGYIAPSLVRAWRIAPSALAPVFVAAQIGVAIGALTLGPLADRFGRKPLLVICTAGFGVLAISTAFAPSIDVLLAIRLVTGLVLGGAMPNAVALTAEWSAKKRRAMLVTVMFCGYALGSAVGGTLAAVLIPHFGWRSVFVVGGTLPILLVPMLMLALPESIRLLTIWGTDPQRIRRLLLRLKVAQAIDPNATFVLNEVRTGARSVRQLFSAGRGLPTLLLWMVIFFSLFEATFLLNWLPTFMHGLGLAPAQADAVTVFMPIGGIVGALIIGFLMDRMRPYFLLGTAYGIGALLVLAFGPIGSRLPYLAPLAFGAGCCIVGSQIGATALAGSFYPTVIRSTGVGWALGIGRIGSIMGPMLGGRMLAGKWDTIEIFAGGAIASLAAAAAAFGLGLAVRPASRSPAPGRGEATGLAAEQDLAVLEADARDPHATR
jgi:MFS transporter, AAHS family, 4-hydroxybenzoate transporter